ncbi:PREDICTED: citron Rho-interacting kinase-like, partial [Priapulus caudatus]|uniref:non-specific serine/threonine protein kinase n=1 Tax=Priapulus caudatus TaxID=37621 RepID=A0ABM1F042_PRICU
MVEPLNEPISMRMSRLHQVFMGKPCNISNNLYQSLVSKEGLLDSLFVLYNECNNEYMIKQNKGIAEFVSKFRPTIQELTRLRIGIGDFEVKNVIGRGHFGEVQVVREKQTGDVYAMKTLRKAETLNQQNVAFYEEERDIMVKASTPWITQLQYAFQDARNIYLVMEFHPGGDLLSLLARYDDILEEDMARFYLAEMVLAIHSLHLMGYKSLRFPDDGDVSAMMRALISGLLADTNQRLGYEQLCQHAFFRSVDFDSIRGTVPPFVPIVKGQDDTSNFDEFEREAPRPCLDDYRARRGFVGKDLPFVGFTYTKSVHSDRFASKSESCDSPILKSIDEKLRMKNVELQRALQKVHKLETIEGSQRQELDKVKSHSKEMKEALSKAEAERDIIERGMAKYITEANTLRRSMDTYKQEKAVMEEKALRLLQEIREKHQMQIELSQQQLRDEVEQLKGEVVEIEEERYRAVREKEKAEGELREQRSCIKQLKGKIVDMKEKSSKMQGSQLSGVTDLQQQLARLTEDSGQRTNDLQNKLSQSMATARELRSQAEEMEARAAEYKRQTKNIRSLTEEVQRLEKLTETLTEELRESRTSERAGGDDAAVAAGEDRTAEYEEKIRDLERQLRGADRRESRLLKVSADLQVKDTHIQELAEAVATLEIRLRDEREKPDHAEEEERKRERERERRKELESKLQDMEQQLKLTTNQKTRLQESVDRLEASTAAAEHRQGALPPVSSSPQQQRRRSMTRVGSRSKMTDEEYNAHVEDCKECRRRHDEKLADLKQENYYLQTTVGKLEKELDKVGAARDAVKMKAQLEEQTRSLRSQLEEARKQGQESAIAVARLAASDRSEREKVARMEEELVEVQREAEHYVTKIEEMSSKTEQKKQEASASTGELRMLRRQLQEAAATSERLTSEMQNKDEHIRREAGAKNKWLGEKETLLSELSERKHICDSQDVGCNDRYTRDVVWAAAAPLIEVRGSIDCECVARQVALRRADELEAHIRELQLTASREVAAREATHTKLHGAQQQLRTLAEAHASEAEARDDILAEYKHHTEELTQQLADLEQLHATTTIDHKNAQKRLDMTDNETICLKEELSRNITELNAQNASNFRLRQAVEEAVEKGELLGHERDALVSEIDTSR